VAFGPPFSVTRWVGSFRDSDSDELSLVQQEATHLSPAPYQRARPALVAPSVLLSVLLKPYEAFNGPSETPQRDFPPCRIRRPCMRLLGAASQCERALFPPGSGGHKESESVSDWTRSSRSPGILRAAPWGYQALILLLPSRATRAVGTSHTY
jgi:hypothetical protein